MEEEWSFKYMRRQKWSKSKKEGEMDKTEKEEIDRKLTSTKRWLQDRGD